MTAKQFCEVAAGILDSSTRNKRGDFAVLFVKLKMCFCREFQKDKLGKVLIFSMRFGADFFTETLFRLENKKILIPADGEILGVYDKNFNEWLKNNW